MAVWIKQVGKLFVMLKLINGSAQQELVFVSAKEPKERGAAEGLLNAVKAVKAVKIWCAVHHSQLAWKNLTDNVAELKVLIRELKSISAYFHTSGVRTRECNETGEEHKLTVKSYPEYFQIYVSLSFCTS